MILTATDLRLAGFEPTCACGGALTFYGKRDTPKATDDRWETIEATFVKDVHVSTRARKCSVIACSDCEMVIDVSDAEDLASVVVIEGEGDDRVVDAPNHLVARAALAR